MNKMNADNITPPDRWSGDVQPHGGVELQPMGKGSFEGASLVVVEPTERPVVDSKKFKETSTDATSATWEIEFKQTPKTAILEKTLEYESEAFAEKRPEVKQCWQEAAACATEAHGLYDSDKTQGEQWMKATAKHVRRKMEILEEKNKYKRNAFAENRSDVKQFWQDAAACAAKAHAICDSDQRKAEQWMEAATKYVLAIDNYDPDDRLSAYLTHNCFAQEGYCQAQALEAADDEQSAAWEKLEQWFKGIREPFRTTLDLSKIFEVFPEMYSAGLNIAKALEGGDRAQVNEAIQGTERFEKTLIY